MLIYRVLSFRLQSQCLTRFPSLIMVHRGCIQSFLSQDVHRGRSWLYPDHDREQQNVGVAAC